jgi:hypothetical protein
MLVLQIAGAWTLLSLTMVGFWVLSLECARRFGSKPVSKPRGSSAKTRAPAIVGPSRPIDCGALESAGPLARLSICPG